MCKVLVSALVPLFLVILLLPQHGVDSRRGRGRGRGRGKSFSKLPIVFDNPESKAYYDHPDGAKIFSASHFESEYILGRKIVFICAAKGSPRPKIIWLKDGIELYNHQFFYVHERKIGDSILKSKMEIDPASQKDAGSYECVADNKYAVDRRFFRTDYAIFSVD